MKIINYEELFGEFKPDGAISTDANPEFFKVVVTIKLN